MSVMLYGSGVSLMSGVVGFWSGTCTLSVSRAFRIELHFVMHACVLKSTGVDWLMLSRLLPHWSVLMQL